MSTPENTIEPVPEKIPELSLSEDIFEKTSQIAEIIERKNPAAGEDLKESIQKAKVNAFIYADETLDVLLGGKPKPVTENRSSHDVVASFLMIGWRLKDFNIPLLMPKEFSKRDALIETAALGYVRRIIRDYEKDPSGKDLPTDIPRDKVEEVAKKFDRLDPVARDNFFKVFKP